jgi:predicted membrane protein
LGVDRSRLLAAAAYFALPHLIALLNLAITATSKMIVLGILVGLAAILWFVFTSKKFRAILWYLRAKFYRWFTSLMIKSNPLDIIYAYVDEYLSEKLNRSACSDNVFGNSQRDQIQFRKLPIPDQERIQTSRCVKDRFYKTDKWIDEDNRFQFQKISSEAGMPQSI